MLTRSRCIAFFGGLLFATALVAGDATAGTAATAMVTDLQGKASLSSGGEVREIGILAEVPADASVSLPADAKLVVLYLASGDEYAFRGPVTIRFKPAAPETSGGAPPERRGPALGSKARDVRIKPVNVALAAVVMRGSAGNDGRAEPLAPAHVTILETRPQFVWKAPIAGLRYSFELADTGGQRILETRVDDASLTLPAGIELTPGASYSWRVSALLPNGRKYERQAEFAVASAELRARAKALRPASSASLSNRVVYATWLEQSDLKDEARAYWRAAAAERPDDARLKALAEQ